MRSWALVPGACAIVALITAAPATWLIHNSTIDVAIDLLKEAPVSPSVLLAMEGNARSRISMQRVPQETAYMIPAYYDIQLRCSGKPGSADASWIKVLFRGIPDPASGKQDPPDSWSIRGNIVTWTAKDLGKPVTAPTYHWTGWDYGGLQIELARGHNCGGIVTLKTPQWEKTYNTFRSNPAEESFLVPIAPEKWAFYRYQARIPRSSLDHLEIELGGVSPSEIRRLFIGTLRPAEYTAQPDLKSRFSHLKFGPWWNVKLNWSPDLDAAGRVILANLSPVEQGGVVTFACLAAGVMAALLALAVSGMVGLRLMKRALSQTDTQPALLQDMGRFSWSFFWYTAAILAVCWSVWLVCFWPGTGMVDTLDMLRRAKGDSPLSDAHGLLNIMIARGLLRIHDHYAVLPMATIALLSLAGAYGFALLDQFKVRRVLLVLAIALMALSPRNGYMSILPGKDTNYTIAVAFLSVLLARIAFDRQARNKARYWILLGVLLFLCARTRHNGFTIMVGMAAALPFIFFRDWRRVLLAIASCLICSLTFWAYMASIPDDKIDRKHAARFRSWFQVQKVVPEVYLDLPLAPDEYLTVKKADPGFYSNRKLTLRRDRFAAPWPPELSPEEGRKLKDLSRSLYTRYPLVHLRWWFNLHNYLFVPWRPENTGASGIIKPIDLDQGFERTYGIKQVSFIAGGTDALGALHQKAVLNRYTWLARPALHLWLVMVAFGVMLVRFPDLRAGVPFFPAFLQTAGLMLVNANVQYRYQHSLTFIAGFLVLLALVRRAPVGERDD